MTETKYLDNLAGDDGQFWAELGIFLGMTKGISWQGWIFLPAIGKRVPAAVNAKYIGKWILEGDSREVGRRLDSFGNGQKHEFVKQALSLAKQNVSAIVKCFRGEDEDGYYRQYRLRQGQQVAK